MDDSTLTRLISTLLADIPGWVWRPDGPAYTAAEVGIYYGRIEPDPDRGVGVRVYSTTDDPVEVLSSRRVQLRFRGRPRRRDDADNMAQFAFLRLQGLSRVGGISGIRRDSMSPLGADKTDREERTDNYTITLDNQEATS